MCWGSGREEGKEGFGLGVIAFFLAGLQWINIIICIIMEAMNFVLGVFACIQ